MLAIMLILFPQICLAENNKLEISSQSYILMEQTTGELICEKNSHEVRSAASVMKTMILLVAIEAVDCGKISEGDMVNISDAAADISGANVWLKSGESVSVRDLIKSVAMVSANDACLALAEFIGGSEGKFIAMLNERAKDIGMNDTIFKDCIGSDEDGNVTSAYDMALVSRELMEHDSILPYISTWIDHIRDGQTQIVNTNKLLKTYQGTIGIKTGTSEKAGSCMSACAKRDNLTLIAVVLGGSDSKTRFRDITSLLDYGFSSYIMVEPKIPETLTNEIKVKGGMNSKVGITPQVDGKFIIPKGKEREVDCEVCVEDEIIAPISVGIKVGSIIYRLGDKTLAEYDILTTSSVEKINFLLVLEKLWHSFLAL